MYKDASLQEGRRNKVVNIGTLPYIISYASDIAPLRPYLPRASILPDEFLISVAYPQCKTASENNFFSDTDLLELLVSI